MSNLEKLIRKLAPRRVKKPLHLTTADEEKNLKGEALQRAKAAREAYRQALNEDTGCKVQVLRLGLELATMAEVPKEHLEPIKAVVEKPSIATVDAAREHHAAVNDAGEWDDALFRFDRRSNVEKAATYLYLAAFAEDSYQAASYCLQVANAAARVISKADPRPEGPIGYTMVEGAIRKYA